MTEQDVFVYREIYYEHMKPILRARNVFGMHQAEMEPLLAPALEKYGWSYEKYRSFMTLDIAQRVSKIKSRAMLKTGLQPDIKVVAGEMELDSISVSRIPELRCPIRSEQKD